MSVTKPEDIRKVTTKTFQELKDSGIPISMLTAYDYTSARILDASGIDGILVGDSASNVIVLMPSKWKGVNMWHPRSLESSTQVFL